jgi:hypothetical protein
MRPILGCAVVAFTFAAACGASPGTGPLDARFVAVHNAFSALGLSPIGPIQEGTLRPGAEARSLLALPAGCVAIVALGGAEVRDLDVSLLDAHGKSLAHDTTTDPEAVIRVCLDADDTYVLVVKAAAGTGGWVASAWTGGAGAEAAPRHPESPGAAPEADGTCNAPIPLAEGTVSGTTAHGEQENVGSCGPSDSRELVYALDVARRERVTLEVEARFDSVLYLRKDTCNDGDAELACSDDAPDRSHSRIERVLDPGKYFVFVDGYGEESGSFKLTVSTKDAVALADVCRNAPELLAGVPQAGTTASSSDNAQATCGSGAQGADAAYRIDLGEPSRVRVALHTDQGDPVVYIRRVCAGEQSEVACGEGSASSGEAAVTAALDPGSYTVFADGQDLATAGHYTVAFDAAPLVGLGAPSDGCGDATLLPRGPGGVIEGDTFAARDDVAGSCGGKGAADLVYRLDVSRRSRLTAAFEQEESPHVLVAWRRCGDRAGELGCGPTLNEVLEPGSYFLGVDGQAPDSFGRFSLRWALRDLTDQRGECDRAPTLVEGRPLASTTAGSVDAFDTACAANGVAATGPDRAFKIVLARGGTLRVSVAAQAFDPEVELRTECVDPAAGRLPELACEAPTASGQKAVLERAVEAGAYWVVVDGRSPKDQGGFTIEYRLLP